MKKYLVTGGAGFIGSYIVDALVKSGNEVIVYDIKNNVNDDVCKIENLIKASKGCDGIFHLAAIPSVQYSIENPKETFEVNFTGTVNVLEAARINKIPRVVYSSSSAVYGDQDILPITENAKCSPKSPYAMQKYLGESACTLYSELYGVETVSLRYFNVYGKGQSSAGAYASIVAKFIDLKSKAAPLTITGDGEQTRDFVHVKDVARANITAMSASSEISGSYFNIGSGIKTSVNEIANIFGGVKEYIPERIEPKNSCASIEKAKKYLKWHPEIAFNDGLIELINLVAKS